MSKSSMFLMASVLAVFAVVMIPQSISAHSNQDSVTITPINDELSLKKTVTTMTVPEDNKLPWGAVKGSASEYVIVPKILTHFLALQKFIQYMNSLNIFSNLDSLT